LEQSSNPKSGLKELACILEEEFRLCNEFEEALMQERDHLQNSRAMDVENISTKKNNLKNRFVAVESKRRKLIRSLAEEVGISPDSPLSEISMHLPCNESDRLNETGEKLKSRIVRLRELNRVNESIIEKILFYLRASAGFLNLHTGGLARTSGRIVSKEV